MEITKEDLDSLPQLDRIEFRQKEEHCRVNFDITHYCYYILIIAIVVAIAGYVELFIVLSKFLLVCVGIQFIAIVVCKGITQKRFEQLECEYFEPVKLKKGSK